MPRGAAGRWLALVAGGGGALVRASPGAGVSSDERPLAAASRTTAASSENARTGRHSSSPSCQTSESSVTAPSAALRRTSATRTGPTGTPLIATYHSSAAESSARSNDAEISSSFCTVLLNAPASAPGFGAAGAAGAARGGAGRPAEARLVASGLRGAAGFAGGAPARGAAGAAGAPCPAFGGSATSGAFDATLVSVTAARTSIWCPHLRHFIRTVLPAILSSAIWYLALHWSQMNFTRLA